MNYEDFPRTREAAKVSGATHYFTGIPCKNGHVALRKTKGACVECIKLETAASKERRAAYFAEYNKSDAGQAAKQRYYEANRQAIIDKAIARNAEDKRNWRKRWKENHPEAVTAQTAKRRAAKKHAVPTWLTKEQHDAMDKMYAAAQLMTDATGVEHQVDHIIPLVNDIVCGLHVPWNLQVLTMEENQKKGNRFAS